MSNTYQAKDLNSLSLKGLISNLQSHEMDLNGDEPEKQVKTVALNFVGRYEKSSKIKNHKEAR